MEHRLSAGQRPLTFLCLSLALGLLLAACTGAGPTPTTQTITVAAPADSYSVEPNKGNVAQYPVNARVFETLVTMTPEYEVIPLLAETWEFIEPNTWRFHLRRGVKFHDGTEFTAEAVQWTMKRIAARGGGILGVDENSVKIIDDLTVDITPARPNLRLVQQLVHPSNSIVAPGTDPATERVGTGPFKVVEYVKDDHLTVERFDGYWGEKALPARVTFRFLPDAATRILSLEAGDVQVAYDVPREEATDVDQRPGIAVIRSQVPGAYQALYFTVNGGEGYDLGKDPVIREAVALAIDKETIVNQVYQGNATINNTMVPEAVLGESAALVKGVPFDPEKAKRLLNDAGWIVGSDGIRQKDGRRLTLTLVNGFSSAELNKPVPEVLQGQLKAIGIDLKIFDVPDAATYDDRLGSGEGDLFIEIGNQNDANPCFLPDLLFYSKGAEHTDYGFRFGPGAEFDKVIEEGCRKAVTTADVQKATAEALQILLDKEHIVIPIAGIQRLWGVSEKLQGFVAHPSTLYTGWELLHQ